MKWLIDIFKRLFGWLGRTGSRTAQEAASFAIGQASSVTLEPLFRELAYEINERFPFNKAGVSDYFAIGQASSVTLEPFFRELAYEINERFPFNKAGISDYIEAYLRGEVSEEELKKNLRELGFDDRQINIMIKARKALLDVGAIQALYNRGEITAEEAKKRFAQLGFNPEQQEELLKLAGYIPSVSDFIRMAVREVFTPEIAEKYGLFEDYPEELDKYAKMAGLDPQYAKYYWAAHWELPSFTQITEV